MVSPEAGPMSKAASAIPTVTVVAGVKARSRWMEAVCEIGGTMQPLAFRTAIRLAMFLNCTTGQCNPRYSELARAVGAETDSVKKVCRFLERDGLIRRNRSAGGNHEETTDFELLMPAARVSCVDTRRDQKRTFKSAATGVQNPPRRVSIADSLMNIENIDSAASPRAAVHVESQSIAVQASAPDGADLRYLLHEAREAYALSPSQAEPLRNIISDALNIMPKSFVVSHITASPSCQVFLASLASAKMELTAHSS
jgi:hypothetical protein